MPSPKDVRESVMTDSELEVRATDLYPENLLTISDPILPDSKS